MIEQNGIELVTRPERNKPVLGAEAKTILSAYYVHQRKTETADKSRTTVRMLQSTIRLSQGHARFMQHRFAIHGNLFSLC